MTGKRAIGRAEGQVLINGQPIAECLDWLWQPQIMQLVPQEQDLTPNITVLQELMLSCRRNYPGYVKDQSCLQRCHEVLELLNLNHCAHGTIGSGIGHIGISGGERRRLSIAIAMLTRPRVLVLDEPTSGLDAASSRTVVATLKAIAASGCTVICTIHQPSTEIFHMLSRVLALREGRLLFFGSPEQATLNLRKTLATTFSSSALVTNDSHEYLPSESNSEEMSGIECASQEDVQSSQGDHYVLEGKESPAFRSPSSVAWLRQSQHSLNVCSSPGGQPTINPADVLLEVLSCPSEDVKTASFVSFRKSAYFAVLLQGLARIAENSGKLKAALSHSRYSRCMKVKVSWSIANECRAILSHGRWKSLLGPLGALMIGGICFGYVFSEQTSANRMGLAFLLTAAGPIIRKAYLISCFHEAVLRHRRLVWVGSSTVLEVMMYMVGRTVETLVMPTVGYFFAAYSIAGFAAFSFDELIVRVIAQALTVLALATMFMLIATLTSSAPTASTYSSLLVAIACTFSGFLVVLHELPDPVAWVPNVSPIYWGFQLFLQMDLHDHEFVCDSVDPKRCGVLLGNRLLFRYGFQHIAIAKHLAILWAFVAFALVATGFVLWRPWGKPPAIARAAVRGPHVVASKRPTSDVLNEKSHLKTLQHLSRVLAALNHDSFLSMNDQPEVFTDDDSIRSSKAAAPSDIFESKSIQAL